MLWGLERQSRSQCFLAIQNPPKDPSVEPYVSGGTFDQRVWSQVAHIPQGRLATYGQIADLIGAFGCARQVGWALRRLKLPSSVPWHRVVNAQGRISMSLSREGSDWIQRDLLLAEGIPVDEEGRLPLRQFLWHPGAHAGD